MIGKIFCRSFVKSIAIVACVASWSLNAQTLSPKDSVLMQKALVSPNKTFPVILRFSSEASRTKVMPALQLGTQSKSARSSDSAMQVNRLYKHLPLAAMRVSASELANLLQDPDVEVYEDSIKFPSLANSVPAVYPTQATSQFHGNNQWTVAVLDTGIERTHSFLASKVVSQACYSDGGGQPGSTSLCPGGAVSSIATGSGDNCSLAGCEHGTQVAGVAAGNGPSFDGVARDANLISIQVYSEFNDEAICGFGNSSCIGAYTSDIIAGLERVFELRNNFDIAAANLSLGSSELFSGSCDDQPEADAIAMLKSAGIAVVAATGNSANTSQMQSPACISDVIAVAASNNEADSPWEGNNISNQLDLFAPGINISSSTLNNAFASGTGTSFATPHVAGALAVMRNADPSLSVDASEQLLKSVGTQLTQHTVTRRFLSLSEVLDQIDAPVTSPPPTTPTRPPSLPRVPTNTDSSFLPAVFVTLLGEEEGTEDQSSEGQGSEGESSDD